VCRFRATKPFSITDLQWLRYSSSKGTGVSEERIHTALLGIAKEGDDEILLSEGLSLVRPNAQLLTHRWDWAQGKGEIEQEENASRYLVCQYPSWVEGEKLGTAPERGANRFYSGLMAIQVIKPIRTLGFIYRRQQIERRPPMEPGQWARMNKFDDALLARVPAMIDRIQPVMAGKNVDHKNALTLLQLMGLEAIFDSGTRDDFKEKLCECLGPKTPAFPNWHSKSDAPSYTVEDIAIPLYMLRNKLAHGADLRKAASAKSTPVDLTAKVQLIQSSEPTAYALHLSEAASHLLCQVLQKVL
jgi:hypothetical protein